MDRSRGQASIETALLLPALLALTLACWQALLVGWTLGRSLPAEDPVSYVKAALFFFCDGRDDLARLYLATARELRGPADPAEKSFREGFLRAATALKK